MTRSRRGRWTLVAAFLLVCSGCSSDRSTEAFCRTLESEQERILDEFDRDLEAAESLDDPLLEVLATAATSLQALGELRSYTEKLAAVAPAEIQVDAELMAEGVSKQFEAMAEAPGDPLGALFGGLVDGLTYAGPTDRVNRFAIESCGRGI